jgi:hypothetical protein
VNIPDELTPFLVPVGDLSELPGNPRRGDVEAVKRSYATFGQRKPIVGRRMGDGTAVVVAGNHQLKAAKGLGWSHIAVVWADDLSEDEARAFALADNRVADLGTYDDTDLLALLESVDDSDLLATTGYTDDDLAALTHLTENVSGEELEPSGAALAALDDVTLREQPTHAVETGEVWKLGPHTLVCADVMAGHELWGPLLDGHTLFVPYPGVFAALTERAGSQRLLLVQPDKFLAGHCVDKYAAVKGSDEVGLC